MLFSLMSWFDHILETSLFVKLFIGKLFTLFCIASIDDRVFKGLYPFGVVTLCKPGTTFPPERLGWLSICTGDGVFLLSSLTTGGMCEILDKCDGTEWLKCNPCVVTGLDVYGRRITWMAPGWLKLESVFTILFETEAIGPKFLLPLKLTSLGVRGIFITCLPAMVSGTGWFIFWLINELDCVCDIGCRRLEDCVIVWEPSCCGIDCVTDPACKTSSPFEVRTIILCPPFVGAGDFPPNVKDRLCVTWPSGPIRFTVIIFLLSPVCMFCCRNISGSWETMSPPVAGSRITAGDDADRWNADDTPGVKVELWNT